MEEPIENEYLSENEETRRLMEEHEIDQETAEEAQKLINEEGLDEDEAIEIAEEM